MPTQLERQRVMTCQACSTGHLASFEVIPDFEYAISGNARYGLCSSSGSFTQTPMPSGAELTSYYPKTYHSFLPPAA